MRTTWASLLLALAVACGKKNDVRPSADATADARVNDAPASCVHARNAKAYVWREEPLEIAVDLELDWTCKSLAPDRLELIDTDVGAKLGEQKRSERHRLVDDGVLAEWDDPFLLGPPRLRGLLVYSVPRAPSSVALRYEAATILPVVPVVSERTARPPKPSMRVVATSAEPGTEEGTRRLTALIQLDEVPRSAGRTWKVGGTTIQRTFLFAMTGDDHGATVDAEWRDPDRVLDVDEKGVPIETPLAALPVRPAKRFVLAEVSATKMKRIEKVSLSIGGRPLEADAASARKLVVTKAARARLDAAAASVDVEAAGGQ